MAFGFDNIMGEQEIDTLFSDPEETAASEEVTEPGKEEQAQEDAN